MAEFRFEEIPNLRQWIISAPKRAHRPHVKSAKKVCPFCPENDADHDEVFRISDKTSKSWNVKVINNLYPFASTHEVIIHTREHHVPTTRLTPDELYCVLQAFINRYNTHAQKGQVVIFNNTGYEAGESIGHAHSQLAVVPETIDLQVPKLEKDLNYYGEHYQVDDFLLICPSYSQWPDEVWIVPERRGVSFGVVTAEELFRLSRVFQRVLHLLEVRHGFRFPYNFYVYPLNDWYIRIVPRAKILGGFEVATGISINTQDPRETMRFFKEHYHEDDAAVAKHKADYRRGV